MLDLSSRQVKEIKKEVKTELNNLNKAVINSYNSNFTEIVSQTVLKNGVTDSLFDIIQDKITKTNDYGLVTYEGGRKVRWENYMEMKLRTDIQNDIAKNMVKDGLENGVVFYICSYHGDCAPDHVDYQGKIYYDKNWKSNIQDVDLRQEIQEYIDKHSLMSIQKVMKKPVYLTSRPNCRHYFQYISIDEVLAINNEDELDEKRKELDLNSKGKYKPEKYEALKEQRYNERRIRKIKSEIETQEKIMSKLPQDLPDNETIKHNNKLLNLKRKLRDGQKEQRKLIKANPGVLQRNYNREAYNRMISNFGIQKKSQTLNIEVKNDIINIEDISDPQYFDENCQLRDEYHDMLSKIKDNLPAGSLKEQAEYAYNARDKARIAIRNKMHDKKAVNYLQLNKKPISFNDLIEHKKKKLKALGKPYTMDDVYKDIIETSSKSNPTFDMLFKRSDKK